MNPPRASRTRSRPFWPGVSTLCTGSLRGERDVEDRRAARGRATSPPGQHTRPRAAEGEPAVAGRDGRVEEDLEPLRPEAAREVLEEDPVPHAAPGEDHGPQARAGRSGP